MENDARRGGIGDFKAGKEGKAESQKTYTQFHLECLVSLL